MLPQFYAVDYVLPQYIASLIGIAFRWEVLRITTTATVVVVHRRTAAVLVERKANRIRKEGNPTIIFSHEKGKISFRG